MDKLVSMRVFVQVAELGSFTAAAERLDLSKTMVTKHVMRLEQDLAVRLLNRTTRRLHLTEAGQAYRERCTRILADIDETEQVVGCLSVVPRGTLRISAPLSFCGSQFMAVVVDYLARYTDVSIDLVLNDRLVDVVEEGYDLAIRIGPLADSNLVAQPLSQARMVVCGAPAYFERRGVPRQPLELTRHCCLSYSYWSTHTEWRFERKGQIIAVRTASNLRVNNGEALREAALGGHGIVMLPYFLIAENLKTRQLQPILEDYQLPPLPVSAVYPHRQYLSAKVRTFIESLRPVFSELAR